MDAESVAVRIRDDGSPTRWHVERLDGERDVVTSKMLDRLVEVVHLEDKLGTVARRLQKWLVADAERVRTDLVLDPELIAIPDNMELVSPRTPS